ncbi:MAG: hypothetical protein BIFFINMI_02796 [Phycisphaerae bacterium]|nr:hypothetical protein [Phycisphaerae bacterium]
MWLNVLVFRTNANAKETAMNENEFQDALKTLLEELSFMDDEDRADAGLPDELATASRIDNFQDAGVLTRNAGLVVRMKDGSEFQLTIVQSKRPDEGGQVAEDDACPNCGEYETDILVWDDDEQVHCQSCGTVYRPGQPAPDDDADSSPAVHRIGNQVTDSMRLPRLARRVVLARQSTACQKVGDSGQRVASGHSLESFLKDARPLRNDGHAERPLAGPVVFFAVDGDVFVAWIGRSHRVTLTPAVSRRPPDTMGRIFVGGSVLAAGPGEGVLPAFLVCVGAMVIDADTPGSVILAVPSQYNRLRPVAVESRDILRNEKVDPAARDCRLGLADARPFKHLAGYAFVAEDFDLATPISSSVQPMSAEGYLGINAPDILLVCAEPGVNGDSSTLTGRH